MNKETFDIDNKFVYCKKYNNVCVYEDCNDNVKTCGNWIKINRCYGECENSGLDNALKEFLPAALHAVVETDEGVFRIYEQHINKK